MSTEKNLMRGYKLGYYQQTNSRYREALIQVELLSSSQLVDERQHEIYDFLKTDVVKILKIEGLAGEKIETAYLIKKPELKYDVKEGEIVRFKHSEFKELLPDISYIAFYTTKVGALNNAKEMPANYTGTKMYYYKNGKIKEKHYYINGYKTHTFGHNNNDFNSMHYAWTFEMKPGQILPTVREYIYNQIENPVAQYVIVASKIVNKQIYDKTSQVESIYMQQNE
jgi:hypothetical protein